ncbi:MAG TPA: hypothetical protein VGX03_02940 [Candidatus Binatia bacterium]|nr:hypothetical protein [Candidatus Binatia bacterium]
MTREKLAIAPTAAQSLKRLFKMSAFISSVLSVCLLVVPGRVLATHELAVGSSTTTNINITSADNWTVLRSVDVSINTTGSHQCVAIASADVGSPGPAGVENQYRFVLTRNDSSPPTNTGSERTLELVDNSGVDDPDSKPVSTNLTFTGLTSTNGVNGTSTHTFRFLGRKVQAGDTTAAVLDSSLSVICVD